MKKQINETLLELIVGILLSGAVIEAGCIVITGYSRAFTSGLCIGLVLAIGLAAHMYRSIDHALDMQPDDAEKYMRKAYMIRAAAILIVAGIVTYFKLGVFNFSEFDKTAWINETDGDYVDLISGRKMKAAGVNIPAFGYYYLKKC